MIKIADDGKHLEILLHNKRFTGRIFHDDYGWYVSNIVVWIGDIPDWKNNDALLVECGYVTKPQQQELYERLLGYWNSRSSCSYWPWCNTRDDLLRVLIFLCREECEDSEFVDISFVI